MTGRYHKKQYTLGRRVSTFFSLNTLIQLSNQKLFLPFWHTVSNNELPYLKYLYPHQSEKTFEKNLDCLLKYFKPIDLKELNKTVCSGEKLSRPVMHLSFDDGLKDNIGFISDLLKRKGVPATFFINSAFVDNQDLFYRYKASLLMWECIKSDNIQKKLSNFEKCLNYPGLDKKTFRQKILELSYSDNLVLDELLEVCEIDLKKYLQETRVYLSLKELRSLNKDGFSIGAHSVDHPLFSEISLEEQLKQIHQSIEFINFHFKPEVRAFAFPFSDDGVKAELFEAVNREKMFDLSFGTAGLKSDTVQSNLQRIPMEEIPFSTLSLIKTEYFLYLIKRVARKERILR